MRLLSSAENSVELINLKPLREQVYEFLRMELHSGLLVPGSAININELSKKLGISKTPLRDAFIQLECEGFVTISPRRGVYVNKLTFDDIKHGYQIVGALESATILVVFDRITKSHLKQMRAINRTLKDALNREEYESYYYQNVAFHDVFLDLSGNEQMKRIITPIKQRLYDFPRRTYIQSWELNNCDDHDRLIEAIEKNNSDEAVRVWRDVHWSFESQKEHIMGLYFEEIASSETQG